MTISLGYEAAEMTRDGLQCKGDVVNCFIVTGANQLRLEVADMVEPINVADRRSNVELQ